METLTPAQDDSSEANPSSVKSESSPRNDSSRTSPPPNCAICLGTCHNKSFTDSCLHQFCFKCLLTWSKVKAECPLCKQNFKSIIHNVQSNHQYEEYMVDQRQTEERIDNYNNTLAAATRVFRYRTTLTVPRHESNAIQRMISTIYPVISETFPPLAIRRRSPVMFRRTVYHYNLWARPLPDCTRRFRDCTPDFYRCNSSQMHRLVPWLHRELGFLLNENVGHISYVIARILDLLPRHHINSTEFRQLMFRYFGDRTEHFLHELYCFASTPYDMIGYDRNVQYTTDTRVSTMIRDVISSSESETSVDSDIVMISSSEPADPPPGPSRAQPPVDSTSLLAPMSSLQHAPAPVTDNVIPIETISQSDSDDDSSEVMLVGYIKPPQDRTPEVVDLLGSDSDVIVQESSIPRPRRVPIIKLKLRRGAPSYDSEDVSPNTPSLPRLRCRLGSGAGSEPSAASSTATASATGSTVPPCQPSPVSTADTRRTSLSTSSYTLSPCSDSSDSTYTERSWDDRKRNNSRRRVSERIRRKQRNSSYRRNKKSSTALASREKRSKHKSHTGKGVKSSKKPHNPSLPLSPSLSSDSTTLANPQPGTSGSVRGSKRKLDSSVTRRRLSRQSKRLKSIVKVINSQKKSGESSYSFTKSSLPPADTHHSDSDSDPEDDLPLNLSIANSLSSL